MTIPTQVAEIAFATTAGVMAPIALTGAGGALYFESGSDLVVWYAAGGAAGTLWAYGVDYSVSGNGMAGAGVLTPIATTVSGGTLRITRATPLLQPAAYEESDGFPAATHEGVEDRNRLIDQDVKNAHLRFAKTPPYEAPLLSDIPRKSLRPLAVLGFNDTGDDWQLTTLASEASAQAILAQVLAAAAAAQTAVYGDLSLVEAVAAVGSAIATIPVGTVQTITENFTVPGNVELDFFGPGKLDIGSGDVVTIEGPLNAPARQIFSGAGTVSFTGNHAIEKFFIPWWGGPNDQSGDALAALDKALAATPNHAELFAPRNSHYLISDTFEIVQRYGVVIKSQWAGEFDISSADSGKKYSVIRWDGAPDGTVIDFRQSCDCTLDGWVLNCQDAGTGILIDGESPLTSQIALRQLYIFNVVQVGGPESDFIGIDIAKTALTNCEFMTIEDVTVSLSFDLLPTGICCRIAAAGSSNAHGHIFRNTTFRQGAIGLHAANAGFRTEGWFNFTSNRIDIKIDDQSYPCDIGFMDSEGSDQMFVLTGSNGGVHVHHSRLYGGHAVRSVGKGLVELNGIQNLRFTNNEFGAPPAGAFTFDFTGAASGLRLILENNRYGPLNDPNDGNVNGNLWTGDIDAEGCSIVTINDGFFGARYRTGIYTRRDGQIVRLGGTVEKGRGANLTIDGSGVIAPTHSFHRIAASGTLKTITPSLAPVDGQELWLQIPAGGVTADTTGNLARAASLTALAVYPYIYDSATSKWVGP